jgi:hypothetical protein
MRRVSKTYATSATAAPVVNQPVSQTFEELL